MKRLLCLFGIHDYKVINRYSGKSPDWIITNVSNYKIEYLSCARCNKWNVRATELSDEI